jgi:hypothetical protein
MAKKKKPTLSPELREEFARNMRLLEERIAYHERKAAERKRAAGSDAQA